MGPATTTQKHTVSRKTAKRDDTKIKLPPRNRGGGGTSQPRDVEADMNKASQTSEAFVTIPTHPSPGVRFSSHGTEASRLASGSYGGVGGGMPHSTLNAVSYNSENPPANRSCERVNDRLTISQAIERLSNHMIPGASHNSSARYPPSSYYPGTRSAIQTRFLQFFDEERGAYLHRIYGRAGVGKSAIVQSLAEILALRHHLGASVFISRLGNRNSSQCLFITIAYQLAEYIGAYRRYIVDKLSLNSDLVDEGMKEQFQTFIVEPFVREKIGIPAGAGPWVILLDGLDELDERHAQQQVIYLITTFILEYPEVPLVWIVASQPEPNVSAAFKQNKVITSQYLQEDVPLEYTKALEDIERYLNRSFAAMRAACLDVPYTYSLRLIPSEVWLTTKRVLSVLLCPRTNLLLPELKSLKGISVILGLELGTIYDSLDGCSFALKVPSLERACAEPVTFHHASFEDYLTDYTRSGRFHISPADADEEVLRSLSEVWWKFQALYIPDLEYGSMWNKYCERYYFDADSWDIKPSLFYSVHHALFTLLVEKKDSNGKGEGERFAFKHDQARCLYLLSKLDFATICQGFRWQGTKPAKLLDRIFDVWKDKVYRKELAGRGIICEVRLEQIQFNYLDSPLLYPSHTYVIQDILNLQYDAYDMIGPRERHISGLKSLQQRCPQLPVLICGYAGKRFLLFKDMSPPQGTHIDFDEVTFYTEFTRYYIIPYPDPQDPVDFLRVSFEEIRKGFSHIDMVGWPSESDFRKLADATSGRQVFATMAVRFIEDRHHANPTSRLAQVLSVVDSCDVVHSKDRSNLYLDALYTHILSSIPTAEWPNTKRILGAILYVQSDALEDGTTTLAAVSPILDIDLDRVYHLLKACSLVLKLPNQDGMDGNQVVSYHTSFVDYLQEPTRSQLFHVSIEDARTDILQSILRIWQNFMEQPPSTRDCYTWTLHPCGQSKPSSHKYIPDAILALLMGSHDPKQAGSQFTSQQARDRCFDILAQLDAETVCHGFGAAHVQRFFPWLVDTWKTYGEKLMSRGIIRQVQLAQLQFHHIHSGSQLSYYTCERTDGRVTYKKAYSRRMLSVLNLAQQCCPLLPVLICGMPGKRFALFEYEYTEAEVEGFSSQDVLQPGDTRIYTIPYDSDQVPSTS